MIADVIFFSAGFVSGLFIKEFLLRLKKKEARTLKSREFNDVNLFSGIHTKTVFLYEE